MDTVNGLSFLLHGELSKKMLVILLNERNVDVIDASLKFKY